MATQYLMGEDGARLPDGIAVAHTLHGEPEASVTHAHTATAAHGVPVIPVGDDGIEYIGDFELVPIPPEPSPERAKRCKANDDTCNGFAIKGSLYCVGHQRGLAKREAGE